MNTNLIRVWNNISETGMVIKLAIKGISIGQDLARYREMSTEWALTELSKAGFEYIEMSVMDGRCLFAIPGFCPIVPVDSNPYYWKRKIEDVGMKIQAVASHASLLEPEWGLRYITKGIKFASGIGAKILITHEGPTPGWIKPLSEEGFRLIKQGIDQLVPWAEDYEVILAIEPHGHFTTDKEGIKRISEMSDSPFFGINFDTGNTHIGGSDPVENLKGVLQKLVHMHCKDILSPEKLRAMGHDTGTPMGVVLGQGETPVKECVEIAAKEWERRGYEGVLHCEGGETLEEMLASKRYLESIVETI